MEVIEGMKREKNLKENLSHGDYSFPLDIHKDYFSSFEGRYRYVPCHWHPEVEIMIVASGALHYQINLKEYDIYPGEAIFINANQLHSGYPLGDSATQGHCIIFDPAFLYGQESSVIYRKYMYPLLENPGFTSFHLKPEDEEQIRCLECLNRCYDHNKEKKGSWELDVLSDLSGFWSALFLIGSRESSTVPVSKKASRDRQNIKALLDFIQKHYAESITLEDMADAAALSPGECGRLCKRVLHQTPVNYLNSYRIEQSIPYLVRQELSITEIALKVGFSGSSYYAEIFKRIKGVPPREFRNKIQ